MIANGAKRVSIPMWFTVDDDVKVWLGVERL
jgi:hypothetical protein